jgi:hypothetical protein
VMRDRFALVVGVVVMTLLVALGLVWMATL